MVAGPQTGAGVGLVDFGIALDAIMWSQRSLVWWDRFSARRAAWRRSFGGWPSPGALLHRSVLGGAVVQPDDRRLKGVREGRSSQRDFTADDASSSMVAVCGSTAPAAGSRGPEPNFLAKKACRPGAVPDAVGHDLRAGKGGSFLKTMMF